MMQRIGSFALGFLCFYLLLGLVRGRAIQGMLAGHSGFATCGTSTTLLGGFREQALHGVHDPYQVRNLDFTACALVHWVETPKGDWVVSRVDRMLQVRPDGAGTSVLEVNAKGQKRSQRRADGLSLDDCCGIAVDTARDVGIVPMVQQGARWRLRARREKPEAFAQQRGIRIRPAWRGGELADAMTAGTGAWYD